MAVVRLATIALALAIAGCAQGPHEQAIIVRQADGVQIVTPQEAASLLDDGDKRAAEGDEAIRTSATTTPIVESSRSFQTRLGTALATFNSCLSDRGLRFVGIPGQTDDPRAADPEYLPGLIACNNESGIASVLQEQNERQSDLNAEDKIRLNEQAQSVFECLVDRGWDFGPLEPNENGILTASSFPDDIGPRQDEFARDLDACGWNDLDLG